MVYYFISVTYHDLRFWKYFWHRFVTIAIFTQNVITGYNLSKMSIIGKKGLLKFHHILPLTFFKGFKKYFVKVCRVCHWTKSDTPFVYIGVCVMLQHTVNAPSAWVSKNDVCYFISSHVRKAKKLLGIQ